MTQICYYELHCKKNHGHFFKINEKKCKIVVQIGGHLQYSVLRPHV